jgi:hypothetical protein
MRQFVLMVTALTAFGALAATAQAENLQGAPMRNGNQCFKYSPGNDKDGRFGAWAACPETASTPARTGTAAAAATTPRRATRRSRTASH